KSASELNSENPTTGFNRWNWGPPVGWPLQYRVSGQTVEGTRDAAFLVAQTMGQNPNTRLINFDWNEPMKSLRVQVDQDRVRQLGVSSKSLAEALNAVTSGMVVSEVRDSIYLTDLMARATEKQRASLRTLRNLQIALDNGHLAAQPLADGHRAGGCCAWHRSENGQQPAGAGDRPIGGEITQRLHDRSRGHDRGEREGAQLDYCRLPAH